MILDLSIWLVFLILIQIMFLLFFLSHCDIYTLEFKEFRLRSCIYKAWEELTFADNRVLSHYKLKGANTKSEDASPPSPKLWKKATVTANKNVGL